METINELQDRRRNEEMRGRSDAPPTRQDPVYDPIRQPEYVSGRRPGNFEFTDAHRAAANLAYANGKVVVIDRGPPEPKSEKLEGERTKDEIEAENRRMVLAKREYDDWRKLNPEPLSVVMNKIDADHSVAADPVRYVQVPRGVRAPITVEERLANIERRLGVETPEETKRITDRDAKFRVDADRGQPAGYAPSAPQPLVPPPTTQEPYGSQPVVPPPGASAPAYPPRPVEPR